MDKTLKDSRPLAGKSFNHDSGDFLVLQPGLYFLRFQALPEVAEFCQRKMWKPCLPWTWMPTAKAPNAFAALTSVLGQAPESLLWAEKHFMDFSRWTMASGLAAKLKKPGLGFLESLKRPKEDWERLGSNWCYKPCQTVLGSLTVICGSPTNQKFWTKL